MEWVEDEDEFVRKNLPSELVSLFVATSWTYQFYELFFSSALIFFVMNISLIFGRRRQVGGMKLSLRLGKVH